MRVAPALRRAAPRFVALLAAATVASSSAASALAADPTADPGVVAGSPTCDQRYPDAGPAGVDLRLGCVIGELVGHVSGSFAKDATPASSYALVVLGVLLAGFAAVWLVGRMLGRAAGRRLAPVRPDAWWLCDTCRSVNGAAVRHCYSCGALRPDGGQPMLRTDDAPSTTQSFGSTRKRG